MRLLYDILRDGLTSINVAADQLATARQQVATGKRVNTVSDDPLATEQAIGEEANIGAIDAYRRTGDSASARLAAADTVLNGFGDKLTAVIVAAQSARGSTTSAPARAAAAQSIRGLRDGLLADLNTTFNGRSLFAGTAVDQPAYATVGGAWSYLGDAHVNQVEVERGRLVSVTFDGRAIAQGSDTTDMFTVLDDLAVAVEAGDDDTIGTSIAGLNRAFERASRVQSSLGLDQRETDEAAVRLSALRVASQNRQSKLIGVDLAEALTRLTQADNAYRAALGAVSSAERVSLLDYLR